MDISAGVQGYLTALALLSIIAIQLAMVIYRLRRIYEALIRSHEALERLEHPLMSVPPVYEEEFPSPTPHHLPSSPFAIGPGR